MPRFAKSMRFSRKIDVPYWSLAQLSERIEEHHGLAGGAHNIFGTVE
jgi:hypothetical protein